MPVLEEEMNGSFLVLHNDAVMCRPGLPVKTLFSRIDLHVQVILFRRYGAGEAISIGAVRVVAFVEVEQYPAGLYVIYG
jgi:hypothetical protein